MCRIQDLNLESSLDLEKIIKSTNGKKNEVNNIKIEIARVGDINV